MAIENILGIFVLIMLGTGLFLGFVIGYYGHDKISKYWSSE